MAIDKILRLEGASITWTCKQIVKMVEKNTISFDNLVQRSEVWERWRMSELIWSIIVGYPIPPIYTERGKTDNEKVKVFDCLDGKQRCTTIYKFLNDKFALSKLNPISYLDENGNECELDISEKKFSELDEELQDIIRDSTITVKYYDNLDQSKKAEMFRRLNQGKPLTAKSRTLASSRDIEGLLDIGSHKLFEEMLSNKARANKNQAIIVMKAWCMLNQEMEDISFASKVFNPLIEEVKVSDEEKAELINVFDFLVTVHEDLMDSMEKSVAKKLYTETHLVSLIPYFKRALDNNISEAMMTEWLINFFKTDNESDLYKRYNEACSNAVSKNSSIVARHEALEESFNEYFKTGNNVLTTA